MTIDFYDLTQTTSQHSIEVLSLQEDANKVTGLDFFATEAKTCTITFFEDSWSLTNLLNLNSSNFITASTILNMPIKFTKNGIEKVYYLQRDKIKYNKKTKKFQITGIDLVGLLIKMSSGSKNYDAGEYTAIDLLTDTIDEILGQDSIEYNINNSAVSQFMDVENYEISLAMADKTYFEDSCFWGYAPFEAEGLFKYIGILDNELRLVMYYRHEWGCPNPDGSELTEVLYTFKIENDFIAVLENENVTIQGNGECPANLPEYLWYYGNTIDPQQPQLEYSSGGDSYNIDGEKLYYTGTVDMATVKISEDEDGSAEYEITDMLKSLLLINNVYMYSIGNNIYLGNKTSFSGDATAISDEDVLEYKKGYVSFSDLDYYTYTEKFEYCNVMATFLNEYYNDLKNEFSESIEISVKADYSLSLLGIITVYSDNYVITEINMDNDNFAYNIKAWKI